MKWVIKKKSVLGFGIALTVLVAVGIDSYINLLNFNAASRWVNHTYEVKNNLDDLLLQLTEMETYQRGYVLTGDISFLTQYQTTVSITKLKFQSLQLLVKDNPTQQEYLRNLKPFILAKIDEVQNIINLRRNQGFSAALQRIKTKKGKALMDEIQQMIAHLKNTENELLEKRSKTQQALAQVTTSIIILGSILTTIVVALAIFTLNRDINKRMQVEEELRILNSELEQRVACRTSQLEAASRAKDEFLSILSHELRTPLNAILGWSRLLQAKNLGSEKSMQALEVIERNARLQAQLIDDLLDISRIIQGKLRLNVRPVQPITVIEAAIDSVRPTAEAKTIRLQSVLDPSAGPISGDAERLQQVFWNLLTNAIKFTPKGGRVHIRLERVNSHIEVTISDTGQGISADFLPYIFDRFRQADSTTTRTYGGLGLGLAIVRQLVELHGGTISAASPGEGQGATFTVVLPLMIMHNRVTTQERVHPQVANTVPLNPTSALTGLQILVVDDEVDARELLTTALEQSGARVTTVASAKEAIAVFDSLHVDILISDIGMPEADGYELIRQVRTLPTAQGGRVPALALTAYARVEDRIRALEAGFQMHIAKPIEPAELVAAIMNLTGRIGQGGEGGRGADR